MVFYDINNALISSIYSDVFLRIGTNKEAQYTKNRTYPDISSKAFADLLYDNYAKLIHEYNNIFTPYDYRSEPYK